jgi:uncharacterized protein DUF6882
MATFQELLDNCAFQAYERQNRLATLIGDRDWLLDTELASMKFGNDLLFSVQFLGTESEITNTWLWADANNCVSFPAESLELCRKVRALGRSARVEEFDADSFPLIDEVGHPTGHTLAMVAVNLGSASAYYRGPHEAGAVFVAFDDDRIDAQPDLDRIGFLKAFNNLILLPGDTKKQIVSYFAEKGCIKGDWDGEELKCRLYTGDEVVFTFIPAPDGGIEISFCAKSRSLLCRILSGWNRWLHSARKPRLLSGVVVGDAADHSLRRQ